MNKTVIVINGSGGVGKDTLCELAGKHFKVFNESTITPIKEIAKLFGWKGEKTNEARRFLSELKRVSAEYNEFPTEWIYKEYLSFLESDNEIMFVHIREGKEIEKFVKRTGNKAKTLLIRGGSRFKRDKASDYGNTSDDDVEKYNYDYYYDNDLPFDETEKAFCSLLETIINE